MAYNFTKLSEAPIVDSIEVTPNILIEDDGDIKRISADDLTAPQVNADWNETDVTSPAFILNKPEFIGGSCVNIITYNLSYTPESGSIYQFSRGLWEPNNGFATASTIVDAWNNGAIMRIKDGTRLGQVSCICYTTNSGAIDSGLVYYHLGSGSFQAVTIY